MSFSKMLEILQERNRDKIILVNVGAFYIATGRDAVLLHNKLGLKCTCFKKCICKVGIPVNTIEKYIEKINKTKYGYIVYYYDKGKNEIIEKYKKEGKKNKITENNINCLVCKGVNYYDEDEYIVALNKLFEVKTFLKECLKLELNNKTQIFKSRQGVNFCGYKINEYRLKIRKRGKQKLNKKIKLLKIKVKEGKIASVKYILVNF